MVAEKMEKEVEAELTRILGKQQREWEKILKGFQQALSKARTNRELKEISRRYKIQMDLLFKKQKDELIDAQRKFVEILKSS